MSYEALGDDDLPLKLRLMGLLWNLGWFVKPNVKLYRYQEGKRTTATFTDIDVLAIKLLPLQNPITAVCSAKSGKESDSAQIFWLSGVKSYFGASVAYYLRSKASLLTAKALCQKLDIIPLNEEQLQIMEERFRVRSEAVSSQLDLDTFKKIHDIFDGLKKIKLALYNYITERYWIDPINNQLLRLITAMKDLEDLSLDFPVSSCSNDGNCSFQCREGGIGNCPYGRGACSLGPRKDDQCSKVLFEGICQIVYNEHHRDREGNRFRFRVQASYRGSLRPGNQRGRTLSASSLLATDAR